MKSFHQKNSKNWAAWNYRTWVLRLSRVFIFIIHIIRQTGSDVCDSKDSFRYLRDTNETIYASRWRVFIKKTQITEQHGITGAYCVYLTFSFSLFTSFNRQEVMLAIRKIAFVIFATPTKQFLLADEEFSKNPHNSAAWNYRTWVLRLSHVFIFIIHLIQQTGSDVCFRFQR